MLLLPGPKFRNMKSDPSSSLDNITENSVGLSGCLESLADQAQLWPGVSYVGLRHLCCVSSFIASLLCLLVWDTFI